MQPSNSHLTIGRSLFISAVVLAILLLMTMFLRRFVHPLPETVDMEKSTRSFEMMSVVLGLLAGGCMAAYFSFDYSKVEYLFRKAALFVSWSYISAIYLLVFLIMYAMRKAGAFRIMDGWASALLFAATYAFLNGLVLFENWKMAQFQKPDSEK
jgi:phage shock protein PspC (stress-responsive transcriptional regulator)